RARGAVDTIIEVMRPRLRPIAWLAALGVVLAVCAGGCGSREAFPEDRRKAVPTAARRGQITQKDLAGQPASSPSPVVRPRIVALGDSLTAGLGLSPDQAYPALLQQRLNEEGLSYEVVNAGVSGDTSAGGLRRLDWALDGDV